MSTIIFDSVTQKALYVQNIIITFCFAVVFFFFLTILIQNVLHSLGSIFKRVIKIENQIETPMFKFVSSDKDDIKERKLI